MGKYVISETKAGWHFNLKAGNGEPIGTSETYSSESACRNGVESVKKNAGSAVEDQTVKDFESISNPKFELYNDKAGKFRFRLTARNGEKILVSEAYNSKDSAKNGIDSVKRNADSEVVSE